MSSQGWKPGQGLGAKDAKHFNTSSIPKLKISFKDDTLGLGAKLKSQDPIHTRTGLDAFQGLLGRLNGKSEFELGKEVQKIEDRKLAMYAQGKWGSVMFVPGGTLVQGDGFKKAEDETERETAVTKAAEESHVEEDAATEKAQRKEEKRRRKEEKRAKRDAKSGFIDGSFVSNAVSKERSSEKDETVSSKEKKSKKREMPTEHSDGNVPAEIPQGDVIVSAASPVPTASDKAITAVVQTAPAPRRNGRHVIRGKNIQAKKMAFSDMKMLDQV